MTTDPAAEQDEAYEKHAAYVLDLHAEARDALANALAQLADADRWLTEATERDCGGDCCAINTRDIDSLTADAARNIRAAHALAVSALERRSAPAPVEPKDQTRLTADAVLFAEHDGRTHVLLIRRAWAPFEGCWALPGGHVDQGESTEDAAYRELTEETGVRIGPCLKPSGVYSAPGRDPRGRYVTFAYTARLARMPEPLAADDAAEARWEPVDEVLTGALDLAFDHARIIHDALRVAVAY